MGFVAQLGVIALVGMIVRNAIILIEEVDVNMSRGGRVQSCLRLAPRSWG